MPRKLPPYALCIALLSLAAGCASLPPGSQRDPRDRFERYNRAMFSFNQAVDRTVVRPVAVGYTKITPRPVRQGISNFLANLSYPVVIVNDVLQAKPELFARDAARLVVNTTIGIGGLFDPASKFGLSANDEDLGQTFGRWGLPQGPYVMLPLLGPTTVRDGVGRVGDQFAEPRTYINDSTVRYGLTGLDLLDTRARLLDADEVMNRAFDPYAFVRNAYLQRRLYQVTDGNAPEEEFPEDDVSEEAVPEEKSGSGQK
ncbi:MAG TPA: VacJ family lipoprotein [Steroidobacteraceae bacterium]|jgi:phospholipid-binding lipoprotein MlaA|nr:VacJ family lipoprotein [Steroidobacteraceae bacterium]